MVFCPHKYILWPVLEVFSVISCAASATIVSRFEKRKVAPSVISKDDSMKLLAHIFSRRIAERRDLIIILEALEKFHLGEEPPPVTLSDDTLSLICSLYEGTFHIGEKEAASTILLTPFLMAAVKTLRSITSRNFKVDGEFVVYSLSSIGRNPASDLAIIVSLC